MKRTYGVYEVHYEPDWVSIIDTVSGIFTRTTRQSWNDMNKQYGPTAACSKIMALDLRYKKGG